MSFTKAWAFPRDSSVTDEPLSGMALATGGIRANGFHGTYGTDGTYEEMVSVKNHRNCES